MKYLILFLLLIPPSINAQESKQVIAQKTSEEQIELLCRSRYKDNSNYVLSCMTTQTRARNTFTTTFKKYWPNVEGNHPMLRLVVRNTDKARELVGQHVVINWLKFNTHFKRDMEVILFFSNQTAEFPDLAIL